MLHERQERPAANRALSNVTDGDNMILPPTALIHTKAIAPAYAVFTFHDDGRLKRRHLYLSLHSAIKAQERAQAKGQRFELMLVELVPVASTPMVIVGGEA